MADTRFCEKLANEQFFVVPGIQDVVGTIEIAVDTRDDIVDSKTFRPMIGCDEVTAFAQRRGGRA